MLREMRTARKLTGVRVAKTLQEQDSPPEQRPGAPMSAEAALTQTKSGDERGRVAPRVRIYPVSLRLISSEQALERGSDSDFQRRQVLLKHLANQDGIEIIVSMTQMVA